MYRQMIKTTRQKLPNFVKPPLRQIRGAFVHLRSAYGGLTQKALFEGIEMYCMFLGYPRSGHSLVGSLIDAHPSAIISHELDALKYIQEGFSRNQLFFLILQNSQRFAKTGRIWTGYSYEVPKQWQGRYSTLKVIGDKKGGKSVRRLQSNPNLLSQLQDVIELDIKYIHVTRNPYDNISTIFRKSNYNLQQSINFYFNLCQTIEDMKRQLPARDVFDIKLESIISSPPNSMKKICQFLSLTAPKAYLDSCTSVIFDQPRKTRYNIPWTPELIQLTQSQIEAFPFLSGYNYDD